MFFQPYKVHVSVRLSDFFLTYYEEKGSGADVVLEQQQKRRLQQLISYSCHTIDVVPGVFLIFYLYKYTEKNMDKI